MKALLIALFIVFSFFRLAGCDYLATNATTPPSTLDRFQTIDLFSINDFHGGAYSDVETLSRIGELLSGKKETEGDAIIVANGDMFQGTAFSSYYHGLPLVEIMNLVGFDALVLGNHEFDWGIDAIGRFKDGEEDNGEARFPILAANIVSTTTGEPIPWTEPYVITDIEGVRVGLIGVIGDVYDSISASRSAGYAFLPAADTVKAYAYQLRTAKGCNVIVAAIHDYASVFG